MKAIKEYYLLKEKSSKELSVMVNQILDIDPAVKDHTAVSANSVEYQPSPFN